MKCFNKIIFAIIISACISTISANAEDVNDESINQLIPVQEFKTETPDKMYGIGSVSKIFTASAVMKLAEEKLIDLDTPITTYIPDFIMQDERYKEITPRMLLNHSSGFMGMTDNNSMLLGDNDTWNHDNFLRLLSTQMLKHNPGEISVYSNDSFTLAEILVENVSGMTFTEYLNKTFFEPMGLNNIKSPQSDFDRAKLASIYGNTELQSETFNVIGSGGLYSTMEDLCKFGELFTNDSEYRHLLSEASVTEMSADQHMSKMAADDSDTVVSYGLGWDCVDTYPFNTLGIKAVSKGGDTARYNTSLEILPEYNLSVAVSASGGNYAQFIAQEILIAVLEEEGLIDEVKLELPELHISDTVMSKDLNEYKGIYDTGIAGVLLNIEFSDNKLLLSTIGSANDRTMEYNYLGDNSFSSSDDGFFWLTGFLSAEGGTRGITKLNLITNEQSEQMITCNTYLSVSGLSQTAVAMPIAKKLIENPVSKYITSKWENRSNTTYFLTNEKYSSLKYFSAPIARIELNENAPGYILSGSFKNSKHISAVRIQDENTAVGFQNIPTMFGRDTNNIIFTNENNIDTLNINNYQYISETSLKKLSEINKTVIGQGNASWYTIDNDIEGQYWNIKVPQEGSYFIYDKDFNVFASSLEKTLKNVVTLPKDGYIAFVGNGEFTISQVSNN